MTKSELLKAVAQASGENQATVEAVLNGLSMATSKALGEGDDLTIPGIAKLSTKERAARQARNPRTGEAIDVPAKTVVAVKVAKALADHVA